MKIRNATRVLWDFRWSHDCIRGEAITSLKGKDGGEVRVVQMFAEREDNTGTIWIELTKDMTKIAQEKSYLSIRERIRELAGNGILTFDTGECPVQPLGFRLDFDLRNGENFRKAAIKRGILILQLLGLSKEGVERDPEIILLPEAHSGAAGRWIPLGELLRRECAQEMLL